MYDHKNTQLVLSIRHTDILYVLSTTFHTDSLWCSHICTYVCMYDLRIICHISDETCQFCLILNCLPSCEPATNVPRQRHRSAVQPNSPPTALSLSLSHLFLSLSLPLSLPLSLSLSLLQQTAPSGRICVRRLPHLAGGVYSHHFYLA